MFLRYIILYFPLTLWAQVKVLSLVPAQTLIAQDILGPEYHVETLFKEPFDVHALHLKPSHKVKLDSADYIISTGEFAPLLKNYESKIITAAAKDKVYALNLPTAPACSCEHHHHEHSHEHHHNHEHNHSQETSSEDHYHLSHEWLSFQWSEQLAINILEKFSEIDVEQKTYLEQRFKEFHSDLTALRESMVKKKFKPEHVLLCHTLFHLERELNTEFGPTLKHCHDSTLSPKQLEHVLNNPDLKYLVVEYPIQKTLIDKILAKTQLEPVVVDTLGFESLDKSITYTQYLKNLLGAFIPQE